jgi:hypothetical protein
MGHTMGKISHTTCIHHGLFASYLMFYTIKHPVFVLYKPLTNITTPCTQYLSYSFLKKKLNNTNLLLLIDLYNNMILFQKK